MMTTLTDAGIYTLPQRRQSVLRALAMAGGAGATLLWLGATDVSSAWPELSLVGAATVGLAMAVPKRGHYFPLYGLAAAAAVLLVGGSAGVILGCAALGLAASWLLGPPDHEPVDLFNGAAAGTLGSAVALGFLSLPLDPISRTLLASASLSLALVPGLLRWKQKANIPSTARVKATLEEPYQAPVLQALDIYTELRRARPDGDTLEGLAEVTGWVYQLSLSGQTLSEELKAVNREDVAEQIELLLMEAEDSSDDFTRDRQLATAQHLSKLLEHADQLALEQRRLGSLLDYALAYLKEARVGLVLARTLPGEQAPSRLSEVLERLRTHAREGDARRQTAREVQALAR